MNYSDYIGDTVLIRSEEINDFSIAKKGTGRLQEVRSYIDSQSCVDELILDFEGNNIAIPTNSLLQFLPYKLLNCENTEYYYVRDITGCIEKIIDKNKKTMVLYRYSSYGEVYSTLGDSLTSSEETIAETLRNNNVSYKLLEKIYKSQKVKMYTNLHGISYIFSKLSKMNFIMACVLTNFYLKIRLSLINLK